MQKQYLLALLVISIFTGCQQNFTAETKVSAYYNIDSLLNLHLTDPAYTSREVFKKVRMDQKSEEKSVKLDSGLLVDELNILRDLDLNKADLVGAYNEAEEDNTIKYQKKSSDGYGDIQQMEITFSDENIQITAHLVESNSLYDLHRQYQVNFVNGRLKNYKVTGHQKMILKDTTTFEVEVNF